MNEEQMNLFIEAGRRGVVAGLYHPVEWFDNYTLYTGYNTEAGKVMTDVFVAFYQKIYGKTFTKENLYQMVREHYGEDKW